MNLTPLGYVLLIKGGSEVQHFRTEHMSEVEYHIAKAQKDADVKGSKLFVSLQANWATEYKGKRKTVEPQAPTNESPEICVTVELQ